MPMASSLQNVLVDQILNHFPKKAAAVDFLGQFLGLSPDGVYRRLRGETLLTPDEVFALAKEFGISIDNIIHNDEQNLLFSFNAFKQPVTDFNIYIDQLLLAADQILQLPEVELYYTAQELSIIFLTFFSPGFCFSYVCIWLNLLEN
jgi:transcriptional regulator with XRE-family HTH domain